MGYDKTTQRRVEWSAVEWIELFRYINVEKAAWSVFLNHIGPVFKSNLTGVEFHCKGRKIVTNEKFEIIFI